MMHMDDCLAATWALMSAPKGSLTRTTYNVTAVSFTPAQLARAIAKKVPGFAVDYKPDFRDAIARTWPASVDDSAARRDWGWRHALGTDELVDAMLGALAPAYEAKAKEEREKEKEKEKEKGGVAGGAAAAAAA